MSEAVFVFHMRDLGALFSHIPIDLSPNLERSGNVIILQCVEASHKSEQIQRTVLIKPVGSVQGAIPVGVWDATS